MVDEFQDARELMVRKDIVGRGVKDPKVLDAMRKVKRHNFVPEGARAQSYADHPLPIGYGQTISQPYIVALMTESLKLSGGERVLEVGTGSGYQAAVLGEIASEVYTVEIIKGLSERAFETLEGEGYGSVFVRHGNGFYGLPEHAPYDAIIITAAAGYVPPPLIEQLREGGRLIAPLGSTRTYQTLTLITKTDDGLKSEYITSVRFVPLTGEVLKRPE